MPGTLAKPDPLFESRRIVDRIVGVTGLSAEQVIEQLQQEERDLGSTVRDELARRRIEPYVWTEQLIEFYRESPAMLFETVVWNRTVTKGAMRQWMLDFLARQNSTPLRILTYGDGLGFDSLALAQAGHQVDYFEVAENCRRFAGALFADAGAEVNTISSPNDLSLGSYDTVVCLDVLEHVLEPCETVEFLASALRPGGHLVVHAPFYYLSPAVQTHLQSNRKYSGALQLYRRSGLRAVDAALFWNPLILERTGLGVTPTRRSWSASARLWAGKLLLMLGRHWAAPYVAASQWMIAHGQQEWSDLGPLREELVSERMSARAESNSE